MSLLGDTPQEEGMMTRNTIFGPFCVIQMIPMEERLHLPTPKKVGSLLNVYYYSVFSMGNFDVGADGFLHQHKKMVAEPQFFVAQLY